MNEIECMEYIWKIMKTWIEEMKIERKKKFTFLPRVKREEPVFGNEGVY